ncbi:unnamed protein product [Lupinus luteus]|uniref:Uncharacterized protein n=1 Tax=Lupinus luteus TaxID=3873 RepID=A0AAV1XIU2_LUPLU
MIVFFIFSIAFLPPKKLKWPYSCRRHSMEISIGLSKLSSKSPSTSSERPEEITNKNANFELEKAKNEIMKGKHSQNNINS